MITIKDIAKEADVSEGTVDRVIHNRGGVSKKTERKIRLILDKYNYQANPVARALALKKKYSIAALIPAYDELNVFWKYPHLGIKKASEEVKNFGVQVREYRFDQFDPASYLRQFENLTESKPSGVIIVPSFIKETRILIKKLEALKIPYLFFNIDAEGFNNLSFIGQDSFQGGFIAGKLMDLTLGGQPSSILIVETRSNITKYHSISKRMEGFKNYFKNRKNRIDNVNFIIHDFSMTKDARDALNSFLDKRDDIRGIFVPSSRISIIAGLIEDSRLRKLEMIGFDNTPQNINCLEKEEISFLISQKPFLQGYESVHIMSEYLAKNKKPKKKLYTSIDILIKENAKYSGRAGLEFENQE